MPKREAYREKLRDGYVDKMFKNNEITITDKTQTGGSAKPITRKRMAKTGEYKIGPVDHKAAAMKIAALAKDY